MSLIKLFKQLVIFTIIWMLSSFWIYNRLETHTVYYFKNSHLTPKKGIPFILTDQLFYHIDNTYMESKVDGGIFEYNIDGRNRISYLHLAGSENYNYIVYQSNLNDYNYSINMPDPLKTNGESVFYYFDNNFNLKEKSYPYDDNNQTSFSDEEKHAVYQAANQTASQLLDNLPTPIINLQWLFDWTYKGHKVAKIFLLSFLMPTGLTGIKVWRKRYLKRNSINSNQ